MIRDPSSPMMRGWDAFRESASPPPACLAKRGQPKFRVAIKPRDECIPFMTCSKDLTPEQMVSCQRYPQDCHD